MSELTRGPLPDPQDCLDCPLAVEGRPQTAVKGIGPKYPKFIVLGEGPGVNEVKRGLPFIGKSGQILDQALAANGVKRDEVWVANTTLCLPPRDGKEELVERASRHCRRRLLKEIDDLGPDPPILAVGKHAASALIGKNFKITEKAGTLNVVTLEDIPFTKDVIPTIHPAAMLRSNDNSGAHTSDLLYWFLQYDVAKIRGLSEGTLELFSDNVQIEHEDPDKAHALIEGIYADGLSAGWLASDTETVGIPYGTCDRCIDCLGHSALEPIYARITAIGFATRERGVSVKWSILAPKTIELIAKMFADLRLSWVWHNSIYDRTVLQANGFKINGRIDCTLYMHHNIFPGAPHKLQRVASQFMLIQPWKSEMREGDGTIEELLTYCARDTLVTAKLRAPLLELVDRKDARRSYEMDLRKCSVAIAMTINGIPVDLDRVALYERYFTPKVEAARSALLKRLKDPEFKETFKQLITMEQAKVVRKADVGEFGTRQAKRLTELEKKWIKLEKKGEALFNLDSPPQLVAYLKACGVQLKELTKKGKLSTKKDVLEQLVGHPAVKELLEYRTNEKLLTTFIATLRHRVDKESRIHPVWSPNKITGRFGSSPAHQNLTKGKTAQKSYEKWAEAAVRFLEEGGADPGIPNLRWMYKSKPGRKMIGADYCLAEGTLVQTIRGNKAIENLVEGDLVFSFNHETNRPDCAKVIGKKFTGVRETMLVVLDNGEQVRCTPDHRWLKLDGIEIYADQLEPGTRLLALRRGSNGPSKYETLYSRSFFEYVRTHHVVAQAAHGPIPNGYHVHHKNGNIYDNVPENLEYISASEHTKLHLPREQTIGLWKNPAWRDKVVTGIKKSIKERGGYGGAKNPNYGKGKLINCPQCGRENYITKKRPRIFCDKNCYATWKRGKSPKATVNDLNHKVKYVLKDNLQVPTWDIEIERDHNFALGAGVFVHNCQLEARLLALLSQDQWLCDMFMSGQDIHSYFAAEIFPEFKTMEYKSKEWSSRRDLTKRLEYGYWYGAAITTVWKSLMKEGHANLPISTIARAFKILEQKMPGIVRYYIKLLRDTVESGRVRSFLYGRSEYFPLGGAADDPTVIKNFGCQAGGSDIADTGICRLYEILKVEHPTAKVMIHGHDAITVELEESEVEVVKPKMRAALEQEYEINGTKMKFGVDLDVGLDWGST